MAKGRIKNYDSAIGNGSRIKELIAASGMDQEPWAKAKGIAYGTLKKLMAGKDAVELKFCVRCSDALDVNPEEILKILVLRGHHGHQQHLPIAEAPESFANAIANCKKNLSQDLIRATQTARQTPPPKDDDEFNPMERFIIDTIVGGIKLSFQGNLSDPGVLEYLESRVHIMVDRIVAKTHMAIDGASQGSIVLTMTMGERDAISLARVFAQGRLDDIDLFRIDFTQLTPKLEAAISEVERAPGDTSIVRPHGAGKSLATLIRKTNDAPLSTENPTTRPVRKPEHAEVTPTPPRRSWRKSGTIPPDQAGPSPSWRFGPIEAMVTIAVIGVAAVLTIPSIQAARQQAARVQCQNNLKQIGQALHSYHGAYNCFPPGGLPAATRSGIPTSLGGWSAQAYMLPYLGEKTLYNAINFSVVGVGQQGSGAETNSTVVLTRVNSFLCPSSPIYPAQCYPTGTVGHQAPGNNYFASAGSSLDIFETNPGYGFNPAGAPNGPFKFGGKPIAERDITDGSSNTIAFGEWRSGDGDDSKLTIPQDMVINPSLPRGISAYDTTAGLFTMPIGAFNLNPWLIQCAKLAQARGNATPQRSFLGRYWAQGLMGSGIGTIVIAPNSSYPNCVYSYGGVDNEGSIGAVGLSSYHPGGANVLMADGSVRFLKNSISQTTIWAMASRAQGEVIVTDQY